LNHRNTKSERYLEVGAAIWQWASGNRFFGHEPYDLLNSEYLSKWGIHNTIAAPLLIHFGRRVGGLSLRQWLKVPASQNPKALALFVSALVDLDRVGAMTEAMRADLNFLRDQLIRLRAPNETEYSWGYDWHFRSFRGSVLPRFSPNSIVTTFVGEAFLDLATHFDDLEASGIASSSGRFLFSRLNRSIDTSAHLCLSYTPNDHTRIYNSSALAAAFQARINASTSQNQFAADVARAMQFLADAQNPDGSWAYGAGRMQDWIDHFHTGYNLSALSRYRALTSDRQFDSTLKRGYEYYTARFFTSAGAPKYFHDRTYPIDIHSCTQAILTFCDFWEDDPEAAGRACKVADWMLQHMYSDGKVFYQRRALWTDRTPYMRWGQAWALRSLARLAVKLCSTSVTVGQEGRRVACVE
jgi:hypothetical protein